MIQVALYAPSTTLILSYTDAISKKVSFISWLNFWEHRGSILKEGKLRRNSTLIANFNPNSTSLFGYFFVQPFPTGKVKVEDLYLFNPTTEELTRIYDMVNIELSYQIEDSLISKLLVAYEKCLKDK